MVDGDAELAVLLATLDRVELLLVEFRLSLLWEAEGIGRRPVDMVAADLVEACRAAERLVFRRLLARGRRATDDDPL